MSAAIQNLFDQTNGLPGLVAAGVFGDRLEPISRVQDASVVAADVGNVWRHLSDSMEVSHHHRMPATQMRWIFENVLVYCVKRLDGMQMGLLFDRESAAQLNPEHIDHLFEQFRNLLDT